MTTPSIDSIEARVLAYLVGNFHVPDRSRLSRDTSLLNTGIVDSTGYLEIFSWIHEEFGVSVADGDMGPENFETVAAIARYLGRKIG